LPPRRHDYDAAGGAPVFDFQRTVLHLSVPTMSSPHPSVPDQWYRWTIQSVIDYGIFTTDPEMRVRTWDRGAKRLFGYEASDVMGQDARFIFTPEDIAKHAPELEISQAEQNTSAPDERWHVRKDGSVFWASGQITKIINDAGVHVGFVKIVRDRTEQKRFAPAGFRKAP
jgi:PAS domain S-box-containing protein